MKVIRAYQGVNGILDSILGRLVEQMPGPSNFERALARRQAFALGRSLTSCMTLSMNIDRILQAFHDAKADCLLIGGVNFLLNHKPILTYDIDLWVNDQPENLDRVNVALRSLGACWGPDEHSWLPLPLLSGWLSLQSLFCLTTAHGAVDIFREVKGLEGRYEECRRDASSRDTAAGVPFLSLSDKHMLECQLALPISEQKPERIAILRTALQRP